MITRDKRLLKFEQSRGICINPQIHPVLILDTVKPLFIANPDLPYIL